MFSHPAIMKGPSGFAYPYQIQQSVMMDDTTNTKMTTTWDDDATSNKIAGLSFWVKRSSLGIQQDVIYAGNSAGNNKPFTFRFLTSDKIRLGFNGASTEYLITTPVFRDCSGWYHFHVAIDVTQATASDRVKIYCNGVQITDFDTANYPAQNVAMDWDSTDWFLITNWAQTGCIDGYLADLWWVDGTVTTPADFGMFKQGIWVPKAYAGVATGNHTVHLDFSDNTHFGNNLIAGNKDLADGNLGTDHQVSDSPTNNHCTFDWNAGYYSGLELKEGGLQMEHAAAAYNTVLGTMLLGQKKWYWEIETGSDVDIFNCGITASEERAGDFIGAQAELAANAQDFTVTLAGGHVRGRNNGTFNVIGLESVNPINSVIMVAVDLENNKFWIGKDGTWSESGDPAAGTNFQYSSADGMDSSLYNYVPAACAYANTGVKVNFGQRAFTYTPPTGFNAICSANLDDPSHLEPNVGMDVIAYTGNSTDDRDIAGLNFQPDLVWIKSRDAINWHNVYDSVRGATKSLYPARGNAEEASNVWGYVNQFNSDGFRLHSGTSGHDFVNYSGHDYVAWCLKKGAEFGFDIVSYEGNGANREVAHNLGGVPEMIWVKDLTAANPWCVYHHCMPNKTAPEQYSQYVDNIGFAWFAASSYWNNIAPTDSVFSLGTWGYVNTNTNDYIAYLWRSIPGFSKVGFFDGTDLAVANGGAYAWCGFRPRWIMLRSNYANDDWMVYDTERDTYNNPSGSRILFPSDDAVENGPATTAHLDILSNGFKIRKTSNAWLYTDIAFLAFAEQPGKYANAA